MKVLAILPRFPYPLEKGDKLRAYHLLKGLSKDHEIYLFALSDQPVADEHFQEVADFCKEVHLFHQKKWRVAWQVIRHWIKGWPLQIGYYYHPLAVRQLKNLVEQIQPDRLYFQLLRTAAYAADFPGFPKTLDYMDAFAAGMQRRAKQSKGVMRKVWHTEYQRLQLWEAKVYPWFDQHTAITLQDAALINKPSESFIQVVSNGIDLDYFHQKNEVAKEIDILFAGNMSYAPNVKAACYLVKEIIPHLLTEFPNLSIALVGTEPHPTVQQLAGPHVQVTGWVDDITSWYAKSNLMVAPMQIGAGLQNKLLEAMAMGLPTVTSPLAQRAMSASTEDFVGVADSPEAYARIVRELLLNPSLRTQYGTAGQAYVQREHNWEYICKKLSHYLQAT